MKRLVLGVVFAVGIGAGVAAQARWFPVFRGAVDYEVQASPCAVTLSATPFLFNDQVWLTYLCSDNRVVMRAFPSAIGPFGGGTTTPPIVCPQGFVHTANKQGCVPPDHPLAPKR